MEGRGGKEKKRKTTREEDRRWQRLPWPGPYRSTWPGPHSSSIEPNYEATSPQSFSGKPNNQSSSMELNDQCPLSSCTGGNDQRGRSRKTNQEPLLKNTLVGTWKPGCHLGSSKPPGGHFDSSNSPACHLATWKLPRCHLVAAILIALLSTLIRPTVGGEDL